MLKGLKCRNYRTLESFALPLGPMTSIVGSNGAGKTTALQALHFLLGERWPSISQLDIPGDFTALDNSRDLLLQVWFDEPLSHEDAMGKVHEVGAIEFGCLPYKRKSGTKLPGDLRDYCRPLSPQGEELMVCTAGPRKGVAPRYGPLTSLTSGLRDQSRAIYIAQDRTVNGHLPGRRGSILSRLLQEARASFLRDASGERTDFNAQYGAAVDALRTTELREVEEGISKTARQMLGFKGSRSADNLRVTFGFADPGNPHSALRLLCQQDGVVLPAERLGSGEQSALVVALFEVFRQRGSSLNTFLIEEPEMYLYPQAQRYFKNLLIDLVDQQGVQVILSTHSPIFADAARFADLRLLRNVPSKITPNVARVMAADAMFLQEQLDKEKLQQYVDSRNSELLYAQAVLLVEGHGDKLACQAVAARFGLDLDAEGISIIACGGKNAIPFFARLCKSLAIPFTIMHDSDLYVGEELAKWQEAENTAAPKKNSLIREAAGDLVEIQIANPTLEDELGVGRSSNDKPRKVLDAVNSLSDEDLPEVVRKSVFTLAALVDVDL